MRTGRQTAGFAALLAITWVILHIGEWVASHDWYATYGPPLTLVAAFGVTALATRRLLPARSWDWSRTMLAAGLTVLLLVPQRLESEFAAQHNPLGAALGHHGWATVFVLGVIAAVGLAQRIVVVHRTLFP